MSFSSEVKHEITTMKMESCCMKAELSAFLHLNGTLIIRDKQFLIEVQIENAGIARQIYKLIRELYDLEVRLTVKKKQNLDKKNVYVLTSHEDSRPMLEDLGIFKMGRIQDHASSDIYQKACCQRSYLAGAFLATGSINSPQSSNYHLEISGEREGVLEDMAYILSLYDINAKIIERRSKYVLYVKAADKIADFLKIVGAYTKTMEFEDIRIQRDFRNSLIRLDNCEVANEVKSIQAGNKHLDAIYKLIEYNALYKLDEKLIQVANLRMDYPESSLNELTVKYEEHYGEKISKSGLQHRFKKILNLAEEIEDVL